MSGGLYRKRGMAASVSARRKTRSLDAPHALTHDKRLISTLFRRIMRLEHTTWQGPRRLEVVMRKMITMATAGLALAASTLAATAPVDARPYGGRGYYGGRGHYYGGRGYHHGNGAAVAVGAGLLGLAAGAAIASRPSYGYSYYDAPAYYAPPPRVYYYAPPPPPVVYDYGYYGAPRYDYYGGYGYGPRGYRR
jgi:hypothetical protein